MNAWTLYCPWPFQSEPGFPLCFTVILSGLIPSTEVNHCNLITVTTVDNKNNVINYLMEDRKKEQRQEMNSNSHYQPLVWSEMSLLPDLSQVTSDYMNVRPQPPDFKLMEPLVTNIVCDIFHNKQYHGSEKKQCKKNMYSLLDKCYRLDAGWQYYWWTKFFKDTTHYLLTLTFCSHMLPRLRSFHHKVLQEHHFLATATIQWNTCSKSRWNCNQVKQ